MCVLVLAARVHLARSRRQHISFQARQSTARAGLQGSCTQSGCRAALHDLAAAQPPDRLVDVAHGLAPRGVLRRDEGAGEQQCLLLRLTRAAAAAGELRAWRHLQAAQTLWLTRLWKIKTSPSCLGCSQLVNAQHAPSTCSALRMCARFMSLVHAC